MRARPIRWYSRHWEVDCGDGRTILLDLSAWKEGARVELGGKTYRFEKPGWAAREFFLRAGDRTLARAEKPSIFRNRFELEADGATYSVGKISAWRRAFEVQRNGQRVGTIEPEGVFSRKTQIDLPSEWPLHLRLFAFWLVLVIWNRERASS